MHKTPEIDFPAVLASAVHDMKNSLSMLLGTLDMVVEDCDPADRAARDAFMKLQYEGKRVNNNLIQLLALYRMGEAQYGANAVELDVGDFLDEIVMEHQSLLSLKGYTLAADRPEGLSWCFDRDLVAGVLNNVINNAYKYTRSRIHIGAQITDGYLALSVQDDGPGYPEHMLQLERAPAPSVSFKTGSTGLGLYFAEMVAQLHENKGRSGYIITRNLVDAAGGCFTLFLP